MHEKWRTAKKVSWIGCILFENVSSLSFRSENEQKLTRQCVQLLSAIAVKILFKKIYFCANYAGSGLVRDVLLMSLEAIVTVKISENFL